MGRLDKSVSRRAVNEGMPPFHWGMRVKNLSDELILTEDL